MSDPDSAPPRARNSSAPIEGHPPPHPQPLGPKDVSTKCAAAADGPEEYRPGQTPNAVSDAPPALKKPSPLRPGRIPKGAIIVGAVVAVLAIGTLIVWRPSRPSAEDPPIREPTPPSTEASDPTSPTDSPPEPDWKPTLRDIDGDCVGVWDRDAPVPGVCQNLLDDAPAFQKVLQDITKSNAQVASLMAKQPRRPVVKLLYFGGFPRGSDEPSQVAELRGMEIAQASALKANAGPTYADRPLLQLVIGTAGYQMKHAEVLADEVVRMSRSDPSLLAVIGLVESRTPTKEAIRTLGQAGLLTIATTLSADDLYRVSPTYLQLSASAHIEAELILSFAKRFRHVRHVIGYIPSPNDFEGIKDDLYIVSLDTQLRRSADADPHMHYEHRFWNRGDVGSCDPTALTLYLGRYQDYSDFTSPQRLWNCRDEQLLADDSASRLLGTDSGGLQRRNTYYVSKAPELDCENLEKQAESDAAKADFLERLRELGSCNQHSPAIQENLGLGFDAVSMVVSAVKRLHDEKQKLSTPSPWDSTSITSRLVFKEILLRNEWMNRYIAAHKQPGSSYTGEMSLPTVGVSGGRLFYSPERTEPYNQKLAIRVWDREAKTQKVVWECIDRQGKVEPNGDLLPHSVKCGPPRR